MRSLLIGHKWMSLGRVPPPLCLLNPLISISRGTLKVHPSYSCTSSPPADSELSRRKVPLAAETFANLFPEILVWQQQLVYYLLHLQGLIKWRFRESLVVLSWWRRLESFPHFSALEHLPVVRGQLSRPLVRRLFMETERPPLPLTTSPGAGDSRVCACMFRGGR